jgi:hypothetical protein
MKFLLAALVGLALTGCGPVWKFQVKLAPECEVTPTELQKAFYLINQARPETSGYLSTEVEEHTLTIECPTEIRKCGIHNLAPGAGILGCTEPGANLVPTTVQVVQGLWDADARIHVTAHELGHVLGYGHSDDELDVMFAYYNG